jgi:hypothetical protein
MSEREREREVIKKIDNKKKQRKEVHTFDP